MNTNPETGIRFGIISTHNLHPDVVTDLQMFGNDIHWQEREKEIRAEVEADEGLLPEDWDDEFEQRIERESDRWCDDEPVHEGRREGVTYRTTWLGGALLLWVFESPFINNFNLCSPCVPNCGDLDNPNPEGYQAYDVPPDWRANHDNP